MTNLHDKFLYDFDERIWRLLCDLDLVPPGYYVNLTNNWPETRFARLDEGLDLAARIWK